jgi:predicted transcriptional regulator
MSEIESNSLLELTADLVAAYVSNNPVPMGELPKLLADVYAALGNVGTAPVEVVPELKPAVSPKKSVFPDYLISLEDGKQYKSLKRHLSTRGMTPAEYREKWKLPSDYPMTAASYSATRSALAKKVGLGRKAAAPSAADVEPAAPAKRGRPAKAK